MLLSFRVTNHRSLRDEQQLLLTPQYADGNEGSESAVVPVAGIFGSNAAGKSNIVDALSYMQSMVFGSHRESEPDHGVERTPFALDGKSDNRPSVYVVDVLCDGVRYTYGFSVDDSRVREEWLYAYPRGRKRVVYERMDDRYHYGEHSPKPLEQVAELVDSNVLFLSVAARSRQEVVRPIYRWLTFALRIRRTPSGRFPSRSASINDEFIDPLTDILRAADTGIERIELKKRSPEEIALLESRYPDAPPEAKKALRAQWERGAPVFYHRGGESALALSDQSTGTQMLLQLAVPALGVLRRGGVYVVDELDSSLHTYLAAKLIELFREERTNPGGAQLLFTSHDAALLGRIRGAEVLSRDQIWFVEKSDNGSTSVYPLSDFRPRKGENRERRYLAGRYGAVPVIDDDLFVDALSSRSGEGGDGPEAC